MQDRALLSMSMQAGEEAELLMHHLQVWVGLAADGAEQDSREQSWVPPAPQGLQRRLTDGTEPMRPLPSLVAGSQPTS